jgi:gliding motility-associated-like protein
MASRLAPYKTISLAVNSADNNDTIQIKKGTYTENIFINSKALALFSVDGPSQTILKPLQAAPILRFTNAGTSYIKGFTFANGSAQVPGSAIAETNSNPTITNCIFRNNGAAGGVIITYGGSFNLYNSIAYSNSPNTFFELSNQVTATPKIYHFTYVKNTGNFYNAGNSGNSVPTPEFRNCIVWQATAPLISGVISMENSIIKGGFSGTTTNLDVSPSFVDSANNDFQLKNSSRAIGVGLNNLGVTRDFNDSLRPNPAGSNPDLGAFESAYDHPSPVIVSKSSINGIVSMNWTQTPLSTVNKFYVYKDTLSTTNRLYDSTAVVYTYADSSNTIFNKVLYYNLTSKGVGLIESGLSNQIRTIAFTPPGLVFPADSSIGVDTVVTLRWNRIPNATRYFVQLSRDSTFATTTQQFIATDTTLTRSSLLGNTMYYWRVQTRDSVHFSTWSARKKFETFVLPPKLTSVRPGNRIDTLTWTNPNSTNIAFFKIYRSLDSTNRVILDTIPGTELTYIDTIGLRLDSTYYYWVTAVNLVGTESAFSNRLSGRPYNKKPITVTLANKNFNNVGEFNFVRCVYSMVGSQDPDGQIVNHLWYVNDSLVSVGDTTLIYYYGRGTNTLKLITIDNDGASDTSVATIVLKTFTRQFNGGILGGISAVSPNIIYTADSTYSPITGASVFKLDRLGNTTYPLIVSSKIFTTPSVSSDSSVFITSGSSLNGFNKAGVSLWPTIPLGGLSYVTPTIDSMYKRIYVGVSNSNFLAVNYLTGTVAWSIFCDAPINVSAVITGDRKLVFVSQSGRLYGFRIVSDSAQTAPRWNQNLGEIISKSPAVDLNNDLYFGTQSGKLIKVRLLADGTVQNLWSVSLGAPVESSPVIDARGYVYVGANDGKLYKINPTTGQILWSRQATGAIKSTPAVTDYGNIVFATMNGSILAVDSVNNLKWTHKEADPISANLLYIDNIIYAGSQSGAFVGLYDNPSTNTVNPSLSLNMPLRIARERKNSMCNLDGVPIKLIDAFDYLGNTPIVSPVNNPEPPVWGTFQGNFRRTGSRTLDCPDRPTINRTGTEAICSGDSARLTTTSLNNSRWVFNSASLNVTDTVFYAKQAGTYMRMNANDNGCRTYSDSFVLVVNPLPAEPIVAINGTQSFCEGGSSQLSSSATNNNWFKVGSGTLLSAAQSYTVSQSGQYYARTLNSFGCGNNSDTININVFPRPAEPVVTATQLSFCTGDSATLRTTAVLPRQWLNSGTAISNASASSYTVRTAGFYSLRVTDGNGCTNTSQNFQIVANSLPTISVNTIPANGAVCVGSNMTLTASGASTYSWSGGVVNGIAFTPTQSGNYVVTGTDANGCVGTAVRPVIVNQLPNIVVNSTPASATVCAGTSITLSATGASSYSWSGNISNGVAFTPTQSGSYTVTGTDINGCVSTAVRSIVVNPLPSLTVSTVPSNGRVCLGSPILMTASGASSYSWSGGVTNGVSFIPSQSGSYTVTGTDANGCVNTTTQSIVVNSLPTISVASTPANSTVCSGSPITLTASGASTYSWSGGVVNGTAFNPTQSGTYVVTGTDANGCRNQAQQTVNVNPLPIITVVSDPINGTICAGAPITLLASGANSYSWTGGVINGVAFAPSQTATYTVIGTDNNGCRNSVSNTVTVLTLPVVQIATPTNSFVCEGSSTTLNATGNGVTYQWYLNNSEIAGQSGSSLNATAEGSYTVITRNLQGCRSLPSTAVVLELHRSPQVAFSYDTYCVGVPLQFTNLSTTTYSGPVQWEWDFGTGALSALAAPSYTYSAAGPYIVKLKVTPTRCPSLARSDVRGITIDKPLPGMRYPAVKALISTPTNLSARLIGGSSYQWTPGTSLSSSVISNPVFNSNNPQDYLINIRASSGCTTTDTLSVLVFKESGIYVPKAFSPNGDGQNERLYPELVNFASLQYFRVYNRWGQLVYETRAMSTQGWDGVYNGVKQPMDTYTWFAAGTDKNGKIITANGQTLLIR